MAFENLFIRTDRSIEGIKLDTTLVEVHESTVRITNNPVELGADVADNAKSEPLRLTVVGLVTDTPLGLDAVGQIVDSVTGAFGSSTAKSDTRSTAAYNKFKSLQDEKIPITVQTKLKLYTDMLITNLSVTQDKDTSRMVELHIDFEEVRITKSQIVDLTDEQLQDGSTKEIAGPIDLRGRQNAQDPTDGTEQTARRSFLKWVLGE